MRKFCNKKLLKWAEKPLDNKKTEISFIGSEMLLIFFFFFFLRRLGTFDKRINNKVYCVVKLRRQKVFLGDNLREKNA